MGSDGAMPVADVEGKDAEASLRRRESESVAPALSPERQTIYRLVSYCMSGYP